MNTYVWKIANLDVAPQDGEPVDRVSEIHAALDRQIEYIRNPPVVSKPVPWA